MALTLHQWFENIASLCRNYTKILNCCFSVGGETSYSEGSTTLPSKFKQLYPGSTMTLILQWRHNDHFGVLNHRLLDCLLNRLFRRRSRKTSKFLDAGLWGVPPVTGGFPLQRASYAENVFIWWRHPCILGNTYLAEKFIINTCIYTTIKQLWMYALMTHTFSHDFVNWCDTYIHASV